MTQEEFDKMGERINEEREAEALENGAADICVTKRRSYQGDNKKSQCIYELRYYNSSFRMSTIEATLVCRALLAAMRDTDDMLND